MAVTEASRHALYQRLDVVLGPDEAATLMEHLPPVGWADVATKQDLQATKHELQHGAELIRRDLAELDQKLTGRINAQGQRIDGRIDAQGHDLVNKIDAVGQRLDGRIEALEQKLTGRIDAQGHRLDGKIDALEQKLEAVEHKLGRRTDALRAEFHKDLRNFLVAFTTMVSALAGAVIAAVSLIS